MKVKTRDFLKAAAALHSAGKGVGKALEVAYKGSKAVVQGAGHLGAGIAEGAGVAPELGQIAGSGLAVAGGISQGRKAKRKVDEWRYRHGLYQQY